MSGRRPSSITAMFAALLLLGAAGCGADPEDGPRTTPSRSSAAVAVSAGWLAAFEVAADPDQLDRLTGELLALGGVSFVVSPTECFEGLPAEHADAGYLLGFLSKDRAVVDALVERSGRPALFVAQVISSCTD